MFSSLSGNLQNILKQEQQAADGGENAVTLEDFDLLAVLGRGGFGKVRVCMHMNSDSMFLYLSIVFVDRFIVCKEFISLRP